MATIARILEELADTVRSVTEGNGVDVQVEPLMVLDPTPPCIDMYPSLDISMDPDLRAFADDIGAELITVRARINTADTDAGQELLLAFMDDEDPLSLVNALADDPSINGLGQIDIKQRSGYALFPSAQGDGVLLGFLVHCIVIKAQS